MNKLEISKEWIIMTKVGGSYISNEN